MGDCLRLLRRTWKVPVMEIGCALTIFVVFVRGLVHTLLLSFGLDRAILHLKIFLIVGRALVGALGIHIVHLRLIGLIR